MPISYVLLWAGVAIAAYILIGYPLLLAFVPLKPSPAVAKNSGYRAPVSIIIAVYNGAEYMRAKLETILALDYPRELVQIIVVSDGSTDATESIVREFADRQVELVAVPHAGKASALNAALEIASGEILFFTDVRQALHRDALLHLVANFADPSVGAVSGEMRLRKGTAGEQADMDLYWRYELWVRERHSAIYSLFNTTGCIYAMRRALAVPLPPDTLSDDAVLPLNAFFKGYRIIFEPAAIAVDDPAKAGSEFRRRSRTLAGLWQVFARMPRLFTSPNRMRLHFLSHKFGRLALPWALLLIAGATWALPASPFRTWMIWGDLALIFCAVADTIVPRGFPLKRLTSPARTFLTMNAASIAAMGVFFTSPERFWVTTRVERSGM